MTPQPTTTATTRPHAPLTHFLLSPPERELLKAVAPDRRYATGVRLLIAQETQRRNRRGFRPPAPSRIPIPDTGRRTPHTTVSLTPDELDSLDALAHHMRDYEGITLDRNGTLRRLIHDERRRQSQ